MSLDALYVNLTENTFNDVCGFNIPRCMKYEDLPYEYIEPRVLETGSYGKVSVYKKKYKHDKHDDKEPKELFCIKEIELTDDILSDKDEICDIIKEYYILNYIACGNPYVLCFIECILNAEYIWLITTYELGAMDLMDYVFKYRNTFTSSDILNTSDQLVQGLIFLHSKGIYHLDIKPDNILYNTNTKTVKYIDFGLSCLATHRCSPAGTNEYCPPEIMSSYYDASVYYIKHSSQKEIQYPNIVYSKCDIYSLGITLYLLISKKYPGDINMSGDSKTIIYDSIKPLFCKFGLEDLCNVILNMIDIDPDNRPSLGVINETIQAVKIKNK